MADQPFNFFSAHAELQNVAGDLPHWRQNRVLYFVTFRTADSLPDTFLAPWRIKKQHWLDTHPKPWTPEEEAEFRERFPRQLQRWLDLGHGECLFQRPELRTLVENALTRFHDDRYTLDAFVVAANHVHALVAPQPEWQLSRILHSWKSFTATAVNRKIGRTGVLWQKESYDHIVRDAVALERIRHYIQAHR